MATQHYTIEAKRSADKQHLTTRVREFELELGAHRGDLSAGFNPVETLLSALAACLTTSLGMVAELSHIDLEDVKLNITATRQDKPPVITGIHYTLNLKSSADEQRLLRLIELAEKNSTVLNTLRKTTTLKREWHHES